MSKRWGRRPNFFQSGFEDTIANNLREIGVDFEYEKQSYVYIRTVTKGICRDCGSTNCGQRRTYTPDFFLPNGIILEAKGFLTSDCRMLHRSMRDQHGGLDIRIVFQGDRAISSSKNKTKYSEWAKKEDIPCFVWSKKRPLTREWLGL